MYTKSNLHFLILLSIAYKIVLNSSSAPTHIRTRDRHHLIFFLPSGGGGGRDGSEGLAYPWRDVSRTHRGNVGGRVWVRRVLLTARCRCSSCWRLGLKASVPPRMVLHQEGQFAAPVSQVSVSMLFCGRDVFNWSMKHRFFATDEFSKENDT